MKFFLGIDLGATNCKWGILREGCHLEKFGSFNIKKVSSPDKFINFLKKLIEEFNSFQKISAVGIGLPGIVDYQKGYIYKLTNIRGWENLPLGNILRKELKIPVFMDNDVNVASIGEKYCGNGINYRNFIMITLGTGVGGAIFINGKIYRGRDNSAGEIGHIPLKPLGKKCLCGGIACLERYIGNKYIIEMAKSKIKTERNKLSPEVITQLAKRGEISAQEIWRKIALYLATTLAGVINFLNPEAIIIGGGIAKAGKFLFKPLMEEIKKRTLPLPGKRVKILPAKLGNKAGVIGSAILAKINYKERR